MGVVSSNLKLINFFRKKQINIHLGISPYYRVAEQISTPFATGIFI